MVKTIAAAQAYLETNGIDHYPIKENVQRQRLVTGNVISGWIPGAVIAFRTLNRSSNLEGLLSVFTSNIFSPWGGIVTRSASA